MENGALDIHDAAAWDDSALVAAYDAAIEKYEETHGGSSARTTAASRKHAPRAAPPAVEEDAAAGSEAPETISWRRVKRKSAARSKLPLVCSSASARRPDQTPIQEVPRGWRSPGSSRTPSRPRGK